MDSPKEDDYVKEANYEHEHNNPRGAMFPHLIGGDTRLCKHKILRSICALCSPKENK